MNALARARVASQAASSYFTEANGYLTSAKAARDEASTSVDAALTASQNAQSHKDNADGFVTKIQALVKIEEDNVSAIEAANTVKQYETEAS